MSCLLVFSIFFSMTSVAFASTIPQASTFKVGEVTYTLTLSTDLHGNRTSSITGSNGDSATSVYNPASNTISISEPGKATQVISMNSPDPTSISKIINEIQPASANARYTHLSTITDAFFEANDVWTFRNEDTGGLEYSVVYDMTSTNDFITFRPTDYINTLNTINTNHALILGGGSIGVTVILTIGVLGMAFLVGTALAAVIAAIEAATGALSTSIIGLIVDVVLAYKDLEYYWDTCYSYY